MTPEEAKAAIQAAIDSSIKIEQYLRRIVSTCDYLCKIENNLDRAFNLDEIKHLANLALQELINGPAK